MATQLEIRRRLEEQRKARERMQSAMSVPVDGLSSTPYIMDSFKRSGGWPGQAVDPLFVNSPYAVRVEAEKPFDGREQIREAVELTQQDPTYQALIENAAPMAGVTGAANVVSKLPFLRYGPPMARGATAVGRRILPTAKKVVKSPATYEAATVAGLLSQSDEISDLASSIYDKFSGREYSDVGPYPEEDIIAPEVADPIEPTPFNEAYALARQPMEGLGRGVARNYPLPVLEEEKVLPEVRPDTEQVRSNPILESMYGKFAQNPAARKKQYLDGLDKIYRNAMLLNAIAALTGGTSQAGSYVKMATAKMDAIDKFDQETRLHNIWNTIYFDENGEFRAPGSWDKAFEMATVLGASPEEASDIASVAYDKPDRDKKEEKTNIQKKIEYYKTLGFTDEQALQAAKYDAGIAARPSDVADSKTNIEKEIEYLQRAFSITDQQAREIALMKVGLVAKKGTDKKFNALQSMMTLYKSDARIVGPMGKNIKKDAMPFSEWIQLPENQETLNMLLQSGGSLDVSSQPVGTTSNVSMPTNITRVVE